MSIGPGSPADGRADQAEPIRVLIVDDHALVRQSLRSSLALHDGPSYTNPSAFLTEVVAEATNGIEAADLTRRPGPDVTLLDLQMPVMDGYQATRQIKVVCPACWVVALTVSGNPASRNRAARASVDEFLVKGVSVECLMQSISAKPPNS